MSPLGGDSWEMGSEGALVFPAPHSRKLQKMRRDGLLEYERDSILIKGRLWESF